MRIRFSFVFFCFLEVLFYSGYVFWLRSVSSTLAASLENQTSFLGPGNILINITCWKYLVMGTIMIEQIMGAMLDHDLIEGIL